MTNISCINYINWNAKSSSLLVSAKELNINIDTFAFIDDSDFERREVSSVYPEVRIYDETMVEDILSLPEFDVPVTKESAERRKMYQTEAMRKERLVSYGGDNLAFLKECEIKIEVKSPKTVEEKKRCFDLIHRTNQLNLSGKKYDEAKFNEICNDENREIFIVNCFDKYGSYGQVGFLSVVHGEIPTLDEFAMSCRVANKFVESALFKYLMDKFKSNIRVSGFVTERNGLLVETFKKMGAKDTGTDGEEISMLIEEENLLDSDIVEVVACQN